MAWAGLGSIPTGPTSVTLGWDSYPGADVFKVYQSSVVTMPLSLWALVTNIPGTIVSGTNSWPATNAAIIMQPGQMFFYLTASNLWGETGPSNIANTPPVPVATNLNLHR